MGLDLWFREDISRILASTQATVSSFMGAVSAADAEVAAAYRQGFGDALQALALAFGVAVPPPPEAQRPAREIWIVDAETPARAAGRGPRDREKRDGRY